MNDTNMELTHMTLTSAQHGALQCLDGGGFEENCPLYEAWSRTDFKGSIAIENSDAAFEACWLACIEYANGEDAQAEEMKHRDPAVYRGARGAALALANLSHRILMQKKRINAST